MVVVVQSDALRFQPGDEDVHPVHHGVHLGLGGHALVGDDDVLAADGLVVGDGLLQHVVGQGGEPGVGAGGGEAVLVQPALHLFCAVAEEPGKLHEGVAHLRHGLQGALQVLLGDIPHTE